MAKNSVSNLELHRLSYEFNDKKCFLMLSTELNEEDKTVLSTDMLDTMQQAQEKFDTIYHVLKKIWVKWGIMCIHPDELRDRRSKISSVTHCRLCDSAVIDWQARLAKPDVQAVTNKP